jgi:hypothetical protein
MKNRCGHELCDCEVAAESTYCSSYCEQQSKGESGGARECACGHLGCGATRSPEAENVEYA